MKNVLFSFLKGILAGLAIGLGGFFYILMVHYVDGELGKVLGSALFAIGLFLVCTFQLSLYTGKIGNVYEGEQEAWFYVSLPVMLIGNAIGAISLGYLCYAIFNTTEIMYTVDSICYSRLVFNADNDFQLFKDCLSCIIKSFLCGTCVYLAVKCFNLNRLKPLGISLLVLFVFIFVYCGFQHCIANMFYFGFGDTYRNVYTYLNLGLVILFNSAGPIAGVGLVKAVTNRAY